MSAAVVYPFANCELRLWPATGYAETLFPCGRRAGATRESSEMGNVVYAEHLGYPDCWTALVTHEAAHTVISEAMGHPHSPTLYAVAHGYAPGTAWYEEQLYEESIVLATERYMNTGEILPALHPFRDQLPAWVARVQEVAGVLLNTEGKAA